MSSETDVGLLTRVLGQPQIYSVKELAMAATVARHVEFCQLNLRLGDALSLGEVSDYMVEGLFAGVEDRLQKL